MSKKKYIVSLPESEYQQLEQYVRTGVRSARSIKRARVLVLAHQGLSDPAISHAVGVCKATVFNLRRRYCEEGLQASLTEKPRPGPPRKLTGRLEAELSVLACSEPPAGHARWTHRLLADRLVTLTDVDSVAHTTVGRVLKKMNSNPGKNANGALPNQPASI